MQLAKSVQIVMALSIIAGVGYVSSIDNAEAIVEKDGYRTEVIRRKIKPPWYEWPGIDFFSETLWPGELRDARIIDVQLAPKELEPAEDLMNRADTLRNQSKAGIITAPP